MSASTILLVASGVWLFFITQGLVQQQIYRYGAKTGTPFTFTASLLTLSCLTNSVFAATILLFKHWTISTSSTSNSSTKDDNNRLAGLLKPPSWIYLKPHTLISLCIIAVSLVAAKVLSWHSLTIVDYPTQALSKAGKPVAMLLLSAILPGKKVSRSTKEVGVVMWMVASLLCFNFAGAEAHPEKAKGTIIGSVLLFCALLCEGIVGARQDRFVHEQHLPGFWEFMFCISTCCFLVSCCVIPFLEGPFAFYTYIQANPTCGYWILGFCATGALGQGFTYYGIHEIGALFLSMLATSRKLVLVILSVVLFKIQLTPLQWAAIVSVFAAVATKAGMRMQVLKEKKSRTKAALHHSGGAGSFAVGDKLRPPVSLSSNKKEQRYALASTVDDVEDSNIMTSDEEIGGGGSRTETEEDSIGSTQKPTATRRTQRNVSGKKIPSQDTITQDIQLEDFIYKTSER